ncbi:hypothetical protein, partial [Mycobacterium gastri]|uniref:hypothetical protein n=1 Tax=Mycobacterium gastri TaxID=1777 RepID=UPI001ABF893A
HHWQTGGPMTVAKPCSNRSHHGGGRQMYFSCNLLVDNWSIGICTRAAMFETGRHLRTIRTIALKLGSHIYKEMLAITMKVRGAAARERLPVGAAEQLAPLEHAP